VKLRGAKLAVRLDVGKDTFFFGIAQAKRIRRTMETGFS